jgi:hypothetical protein
VRRRRRRRRRRRLRKGAQGGPGAGVSRGTVVKNRGEWHWLVSCVSWWVGAGLSWARGNS